MMVDRNRETFNLVDGVIQRTASIVLYVCALRIKEALPSPWRRRSYIPDSNADVEAELTDCYNYTICTAGFIVTVVIAGAGW